MKVLEEPEALASGEVGTVAGGEHGGLRRQVTRPERLSDVHVRVGRQQRHGQMLNAGR